MTEVCDVIEDVVWASAEIAFEHEAVLVAERGIVHDRVVVDSYAIAVGAAVAEGTISAEDYAVLLARATVKDKLTTYREEYITAVGIASEAVSFVFHHELAVESRLAGEPFVSVSTALRSSASVVDTFASSSTTNFDVLDTATAYALALGSELSDLGGTAVASDEVGTGVSLRLALSAQASDAIRAGVEIEAALTGEATASDLAYPDSNAEILELGTATDLVVVTRHLAISDRALSTESYEATTVHLMSAYSQATAQDFVRDGNGDGVVESLGYDGGTVVSTHVTVHHAVYDNGTAQDHHTYELHKGAVLKSDARASVSLSSVLSNTLGGSAVAQDAAAVVLELSVASEALVPLASGSRLESSAMLAGDLVVDHYLSSTTDLAYSLLLHSGATGDVVADLASTAKAYARVSLLGFSDNQAWVLNSRSLAHSYYDGFAYFNSAVQVGHHAYFLSDEGLFELAGDSDDGRIIEAEIVTGLDDLGTIDRKRVEQFDLGYTAAGDLQAYVYCEGFPEVGPYTLEQRLMRTAHTSRVRVGKGMVGRYWKLRIANREGSDFELFSLQTKVALSTRRMR